MTRSFALPSAAISLVALAALGLAGCDWGKTKAASAPPPPKIVAATPMVKSVTEWDEYTGRFTAVEGVEVRARVGG
jgi:multidrug efflux system membrane fusion protein